VQGRTPIDALLRDPGAVLPRTPITALSEETCKIAGIAVASLTFSLLLLIGLIYPLLFYPQRRQNPPVFGNAKYYAASA
jgi:hypothetical protein